MLTPPCRPGQGEVLVAIDRFGLTSNNVSYALSGDMIGYWGLSGRGRLGQGAVWGCANVVASTVRMSQWASGCGVFSPWRATRYCAGQGS